MLFRLIFVYIPLAAIAAAGAAVYFGVEETPAVAAGAATPARSLTEIARGRLDPDALRALANGPNRPSRAQIEELLRNQGHAGAAVPGNATGAARLLAASGVPITLTGPEIDGLIAASLPARSPVRTRTSIRPYGLVMATTVMLPVAIGPLGRYVNLRAAVPPSQGRVEVSRLAIGRIDVPASLARPAFGLVLELVAGEDRRRALDDVRAVTFAGDKVTIVYRPADGAGAPAR